MHGYLTSENQALLFHLYFAVDRPRVCEVYSKVTIPLAILGSEPGWDWFQWVCGDEGFRENITGFILAGAVNVFMSLCLEKKSSGPELDLCAGVSCMQRLAQMIKYCV